MSKNKTKITLNPLSVKKLDGVGPVDNRPSTDKLSHFVQFFFKSDMNHMKCDM